LHVSIGNAVKMQGDIADEQARMEQEHKSDDAMRDSASVGQPTVPQAAVDTRPDTTEGNNP
jgi:hypothetical protein